jgi:pimeloyl-ACP methyl ester carboxylesterase
MPHVWAEDAELYYEEEGAGDAIIMITGSGLTHDAWRFQVPAIGRQFRVITYDTRGLGLSRDSGGRYTMQRLADDVVAILDHLVIKDSHVLGYSLGGKVAQEVAITYPERVRKLVLVATTPWRDDHKITPAMRRAFGIPESVDLTTVDASDYKVDAEKLGATIARLSFNNPLMPWLLTMLGRRRGVPPLADGIRRQRHVSAEHSTLDRLHLIQAPTLVIAGTWDRLIPPGASEVLASCIPNATLKLLWGAPHGLNFENPWRFNRAVLRFLRAR